MPIVETSVWINAPLERVYAICKDSPSFPEYMKDVKSVTRIEEDGNRVVSDWVGLVPNFGIKIKWRQEDIWNDDDFTCKFSQVKGDYDRFEGKWTFTSENNGCRLRTDLDYEYNVPTLGPLIRKVIHAIVVKNLQSMNAAFKSKAESVS